MTERSEAHVGSGLVMTVVGRAHRRRRDALLAARAVAAPAVAPATP